MRDFDGDAIFAKYQKLKKDLIDDSIMPHIHMNASSKENK